MVINKRCKTTLLCVITQHHFNDYAHKIIVEMLRAMH
jgi:hypothetical protein